MKKHTVAQVGINSRAGLGHYRPVRIPRGLSPRQVARTIKHPFRADGTLLPLAQRIADANPGLWLGGSRRSEQRAEERAYPGRFVVPSYLRGHARPEGYVIPPVDPVRRAAWADVE